MKKNSVVILSKLLAEISVLQQKTLNYHWNVRGENFSEYHELFGQQYQELSDEQDEIAERIRMMGEASPASFKEFLELSGIKEGKGGFIEYREMISNLLADHNHVIKTCHEGLSALEGSRDEGTIDLVTGILRAHEKVSWILASSLGM